MASTTQIRSRGRPAHTRGPTFLSYTPDGTKLITVGSNNTIRVFKTGDDGEPANIDDCPEQNTGVASTNDFFVIGSEDGNISRYSLETMSYERYLTRSTLPIRDITISPDGQWCAVTSDELTVKIIKCNEPTTVMTLREQTKPVKHLTFDPSGKFIALSCTDGLVYLYSLVDDEPSLVRKIDGLIKTVESDDEICTKVIWHPDGRAFAAPTATRDIQVMSRGDWESQRAFTNGHTGDVTALAWSPNGAMLVSAGNDSKILLWETKTQKIISSYDYANVMDIAWHPSKNIVSFTNTDGEVNIYENFVPQEHTNLVKLPLQPAPFIHDPLAEISANARKPHPNGTKEIANRNARRGTPDSLDDILDDDVMGDDNFVEDDDGAGYALGPVSLNGNGKRPGGNDLYPTSKRHAPTWEPQYHESFQSGSTPWRGNRRYLCVNSIGWVSMVDQDTHNTIEGVFWDETYRTKWKITGTALYDKACLSENGTLLSCQIDGETPASIFYRPHDSWSSQKNWGWQTQLPAGEDVTAISLSDSFATVTTTANYVRIYTLLGIPYRVYRQKSSPTVTCSSWRDYVMTLGNGPVGADGNTKLLYTIQNVKRDEICQNEDVVALPDGETVKSVFWSDNGDPCIFDSTGTLLTLLHWRIPSQANWVPLLDTKLQERLSSGRIKESYFPVGVEDNQLKCFILKGSEQYPYFPMPHLSQLDFEIPLSSKPISSADDEQSEINELKKLEGAYVLQSILATQQQDLIDFTKSTAAQRAGLQYLEREIDKTLLQMMAVECREEEARGMRAMEMVRLMRDRTGRMIEAAVKVAERYEKRQLEEKIRELGEERIGAIEED